ncbi:YadA C-terminal domain-containing protein [Aliivibrio salmonicida]|nr:YadA C-terminal domain-containing protein [Aliivibrio salmonicida]
MKKTILALSLTAIFSSSVMAETIQNPAELPGIDNSIPSVSERPSPNFGSTPDWGLGPTQPPMDDNSPERPQPQVPVQPPMDDSPDWGIPHTTDGERITTLENDFKTIAEENNRRFNEQDEKIDGVRAGLHAVANARPFVTNGEFAIGAGVGFSGSKEALALGGAYGINEKLSVSGTFHYESSGSYSSSDVAGGVGVQYSFK